MNGRHWLGVIPIALAVAGLAALPTGALASAVPGATYTGKASDGAIVTLTVSSDGTTVTSYSVLGIYGTDGNGRMCQDSSSLGPAGWAGAPISNETFQSSIEDTLFSIQGAFGASQSVSGTFQLAIPPTQNGGAGCSTGSVTWTATVASSSGSGGNGGNNGGGSSGGGGSSSGDNGNGNGNGGGATGPPKKIHVRVMFRRAAHARFNGALKATTASCTARRMVYLWAGHRRLGSSRATAKGAFQFKERKGWHGKRLHASVTVLSTKAGTCTAGSSATIRG